MGWDVAAGFDAYRLSVALEGWFPWSGWAGLQGAEELLGEVQGME